ncbi:hypothetical protein KAU43_08400 [candidate division WOR-3 bacterium]|nr:hypothetical protein [candidate division WOR-3 bacterium]
MQKILYIFILISFFRVINADVTDTLFIPEKGKYKLTYKDINKIICIEPDSVKNNIELNLDSGILDYLCTVKDTLIVIVTYQSNDEKIIIQNFKLNSNFNQEKYSEYINTYKFQEVKNNDNIQINGINLLGMNFNDRTGMKFSASSNNHFNIILRNGLSLKGYIGDNNRIFSPEGVYISDISGFKVELTNNENSLSFGDITYDLNRTCQKMIGIDFEKKDKFRIITGLDGGYISSVDIDPESDNLGPYNILSFSDSLYYITTNSENVYIDNNKLSNGKDYSMDYLNGTITFKPGILYTGMSKVHITYQLKSRYNIRHYIHSDIKLFDNKFQISYDEIKDWKQNSLDIDYNNIISGDTILYIDGGIYVGDNNGDYTKSGNIYVYAGRNLGDYNCHFTYMGEKEGDYIYSNIIHGYLYVGSNNGNYSPLIIVHAPELSREIGILFNTYNITGELNVNQNNPNILNKNIFYTYSGELGTKWQYNHLNDTFNLKLKTLWYSNMTKRDMNNKISRLKYDFDIRNSKMDGQIFVPALDLNYKYSKYIFIKTIAEELISEKQFVRVNSLHHIFLNTFISFDNEIKYLNSTVKRSNTINKLNLSSICFNLSIFNHNHTGDSLSFQENGILLFNNNANIKFSKKLFEDSSTNNISLGLNNSIINLNIYTEWDSTIITNTYDFSFTKIFKYLYLSINSEGGKYKPLLLQTQFVKVNPGEGDYELDSLNNIYFKSEYGNYKKLSIYNSYNIALPSFKINGNLKTDNPYFSFYSNAHIDRYYEYYNDSIHLAFKVINDNKLKKTFDNNTIKIISEIKITNDLNLFFNSIIYRFDYNKESYSIVVDYILSNNKYIYTLNEFSSKDIKLKYNLDLFELQLKGSIIDYIQPLSISIKQIGVYMSQKVSIGKFAFTFSPDFNYNIYSNDNVFYEVNEKYPKGLDSMFKVFGNYKINDNTSLNADIMLRYNEHKGFDKTFNIAIGLNL